MTSGNDFQHHDWVLQKTGATQIISFHLVQALWNGYGQLIRLGLRGGSKDSDILKLVQPPRLTEQTPSDKRKRRSYEVEMNWYGSGAKLCDDDSCRVAHCFAAEVVDEEALILLEDLAAAGFVCGSVPGIEETKSGLRWLANFHARFLGPKPEGLWEQGTYWHLATREEEWHKMPECALKEEAKALDGLLRGARYQSLVHGDAKPPNFCWNPNRQAAAFDFQYVGLGCGIRDVALFLDRCLGKEGCRKSDQEWLDKYFEYLRDAVSTLEPKLDFSDLEQEWRTLFPVAWSDYNRFKLGWGAPPELDPYSEHQLRLALEVVHSKP